MANLFNNPQLSKEQVVSNQVDQNLRNTARAMKSSYDNVRKLIYNNAAFQSPDEVYAAFAISTTTGLSPQDLGKAAMLIKSVINTFAAGTIVDDVPEVQIVYPI